MYQKIDVDSGSSSDNATFEVVRAHLGWRDHRQLLSHGLWIEGKWLALSLPILWISKLKVEKVHTGVLEMFAKVFNRC